MKNIKNVIEEESGQALVEYGLILALIVIAAVGMLTSTGDTLKTMYDDKIVKRILEALKG